MADSEEQTGSASDSILAGDVVNGELAFSLQVKESGPGPLSFLLSGFLLAI